LAEVPGTVSVQAVFLDKDGTLVENIPYNVDPTLIRLTKGADEGLRRLHAAGYQIVVISNQSGVARGFFEEGALRAVESRVTELLDELGVPLAGFYYCPHHPEGSVPGYAVRCACRKPAPGLILRAAEELGINRSRSWIVGDLLDDVEAGRLADCETILLDRGWKAGQIVPLERRPHHVVADLAEAAGLVAGSDRSLA